ncbi:TraR/DksA C4-type zinc finger protein [Paucibacter sp. APW11]|uniref:TraR/DksA C4-type zinc finger protein n=1 Tax=Roseateles aquae TaxID=3077235 RepID=A0ABU3PGK0_9BURK|nr:TraR/DksA C4-type zinc finger protein [Paucibacter sp. APW11]MDT9001697.1 TraR/DksA C4-type zinc finger protein [Paucibacter sp. APW11]
MSTHPPISPAQRAALQATLEQQQAALQTQLDAQLGGEGRVAHAHEQLQQDGDGERAHNADRELDLARSDHLLQALGEVNEALARLNADGYGLCCDCGEAIAYARLAASPQVLRCLACQSATEQRQGLASHATL